MNKCTYTIFLTLLALTFFGRTVFADTFLGKVVNVADGDTITVLTEQRQQVKIRLSGVDTPEKGQDFGKKAKDFTASQVAGKQVTVVPETIDKYGRTVGMVFINGSNLNEKIIAKGYGWVYRKYCTAAFCEDWLRLESKARETRLGLWRDKSPVPPWEFRHQQRNGVTDITSATVGITDGPYHGNTRSHVFHGPGCKDYRCKNCTVVLGSVTEAVEAGYRKHSQCVKE